MPTPQSATMSCISEVGCTAAAPAAPAAGAAAAAAPASPPWPAGGAPGGPAAAAAAAAAAVGVGPSRIAALSTTPSSMSCAWVPSPPSEPSCMLCRAGALLGRQLGPRPRLPVCRS